MNLNLQGFEDGRAGKAQRDLRQTISQCATRFGVELVYDDYLQGWRQGLKQFCTPDSLYQAGLSGRSLPTVCDTSLISAQQVSSNWYRGIAQYCTKEQAYDWGLEGRSIQRSCPENLVAKIKGSWERGYSRYQRSQDVNNELYRIDKDIKAKQKQVSALREQEFALGQQILQSPVQQITQQQQRNNLVTQRLALEQQLITLQQRRDFLRREQASLP